MSTFFRVIVPALMAALCWIGSLNLVGSEANAQAAASQDQRSEDTWNSIKGDIFKDRPILDGSGLVILDAPASCGGCRRRAHRHARQFRFR